MAGAIIENMSTKKLVIVGVILLLFQAFAFMVGGLIAPSPTTAVHYLATKCVDKPNKPQQTKWFMPWGRKECDKIRSFDEAMAKRIEANNIVFAVHIPLPNKEMSPWFQFMLVILQFDIAFKMYNQIEDGSLVYIDVGLAYRDDMDSEWTEMAHSFEQRKLSCNFTATKTHENEGRYYECDLLPFMEVGSVAHKYYLLNIRLPVNERKKINVGIGEIRDIRLVGIHQNGGFTKVWFAMKTFLTPSILIIMIWYWRRITLMSRPPVLLEKVILALGISMTFINIPVEWFSVGFNWTWMLLFGDIRQGIFYSMLLSFWIIFCGEHLMETQFFETLVLGREELKMCDLCVPAIKIFPEFCCHPTKESQDQTERNRFSIYWKQVGPVVFGSFCLFIFDMCERGVQLKNPFYSIWASDIGTELAMAFIIVAGICACLYFLFLCFMVFQVFRNISGKRMSLPAMSKARQLHYEGLIFRFKFLMLVTLACAALTVIFFIISQVNEGHWHWGEHTVQVNSAFFTGIYGMWNLYVFAIMFLYAPSHKHYGDEQSSGQCITGDGGANSGEDLHLTTTITHLDGPTVVYKMTGKEAQE
ncbi:protein wntless homolog isoform X1 [Maylandia zebra]|uniref:Wnt ligand secretion mediator n=2 Tax=Haplochromini TaxID=319058 RepID=A0A3P9B6Z8_9CICH|nr:protein wntless homolog isoform X1 [Maylandia zebra]XP_026005224.1 protein wntless homolog isoform X1 [Astatotilapia calliptera]